MITLSREELSRYPSQALSTGRNRTKAAVLLLEAGNERIVLKDFGERGFLVRNLIGRFSVARECRALARLASVPGIPALRGRVGPHALAWTFVPGTPLPRLRRRSLTGAFFDALESVVGDAHVRGVAIADLHHRNVLVEDGSGRPALIDFSLAVFRPQRRWNLPGTWLFERACELDRLALSRIRERYEVRRPASEGAGPVLAEGHSTPRLLRAWSLGRFVKRTLRRLRGRA